MKIMSSLVQLSVFFNENIKEYLKDIILKNTAKGCLFNGADEITFYFEWYGEHSFAGVHQEGDEMHLALIDVNMKKRGYIEPKIFYDLFNGNEKIEIPELIYRGKLTDEFIKSINDNDWTKDDAKYINVKEGVVCRRSTLMKGQRMPKVKIKTKWWLNMLHEKYSEEECKILE